MSLLLFSTMANSGKSHIKVLAHLGVLFTVAAWGTSFISTKVLMEKAMLTPIESYIYRFGMAYLVILALTFRKIFADSWRDELQMLLCGICAGSMFYVLENYALQYTTAGNVSLLSCVSPLMTTALMAFLFRVKIGTAKILGSIIAFLGVCCVIITPGEGFQINPLGDLLALSSSLSWSIYAISVKRLVPRYTALFITRKLFFYGVLTAMPLLLLQRAPVKIFSLFTNPEYFLNLLFLVLICTVVAYVIWNNTTNVLGAVTTNNYLYLQPPITMVAAYFFFGEKIGIFGYIGCVLIIGGLIISDKLKMNRQFHHVRK